MKYRVNDDVRFMLSCRGISKRELADEIGVPVDTLNRWLSKELSMGTDKKIMTAMHRLEAKKQHEQ